ncbi:MAG: DUF1564 family protein [Leptospiraceae bacterium]|nr:DUF1564 family protein [Leptospiraceae bacterium]MCP5486795.1 DUF1564 family protein [Spirochaetales bacterium]
MSPSGLNTTIHPQKPELARCKALVPARYKSLLAKRLQARRIPLSGYLPVLVRLASSQAHNLPVRPRFTAFYQEPGQDLQPVNFCVSGQLWGEFKLIARGCGVSMCYLFVHLMLLDEQLALASRGRRRNARWTGEVSKSIRLEMKEIVQNSWIRLSRTLIIETVRSDPLD